MAEQESPIPLREAAQRLGIRPDSLRRRAQRQKDDAGPFIKQDDAWYVLIEQFHDIAESLSRDTSPDMSRDMSSSPVTSTEATTRDLVAALREQLTVKDEQITSLSRTVEILQRDHARQVQELHVLLQNTQRLIPAVFPDEPPAREQSADSETPPKGAPIALGGVQREIEASQRPPRRSSWWARLLGWE